MPSQAERPRRWRPARLARRALLLFVLVLLVPCVVALGRAAAECRMLTSSSAPEAEAPVGPGAELDGYARPEEQTYLTLPEWYIVYSADEYAAFVAKNPPSRFPYFKAIGQFWQSYYDVCAVTRDRYAFNSGYHLMLGVIGTSFTVENIIKGSYENTIGRLAESLSSPELSAEDAYGARVAAEYGTFIHTVPWFEFPFAASLQSLWQETPAWGPNPIRKWERRAALSSEYGTKAGYGWVLQQGTAQTYEPENLEIYALVEGLTPAMLRQQSVLRVIEERGDGKAVLALPRYEAFTRLVPELTSQGLRFTEIAGNREVLVTVLAPVGWTPPAAQGEVLFAMPILTEEGRTRVALRVPVPALHELLATLGDTAKLEHIYDY